MSGIDAFYKEYIVDDSIVHKIGHNPYYLQVKGFNNDTLMLNEGDYIDLATNNYLGIANHPSIIDASIEALRQYGASLCSTPIAGGFSQLYRQVSEQLAAFTGVESTLLYPSCYQANNGLLSVIGRKNDVVLIDQYAHSSLIEGAKAIGCKLRPYKHNDMNSLEKNLIHCTENNHKFIVTESVFSTEGSIAPLSDIVDLAQKHNAIPIVDDSHGIGVIGKSGKGILEHENLENYPGIYTASLGKALANTGGVVGGRKSFIKYLKYYSSHLVYSTALPPHVLAGISAAVKLIENDFDELSQKMWQINKVLKEEFIKAGFSLADSKAPIISIQTGSPENTLLLAKKFYDNKIITTSFIYPSVPMDKGVIRIIAGANLADESLNKIINCIHSIINI